MKKKLKISLLTINFIALCFAINWVLKSNFENEPIVTAILLVASFLSIMFEDIVLNKIRINKSKKIDIRTAKNTDADIAISKSEDVKIEIQKKKIM